MKKTAILLGLLVFFMLCGCENSSINESHLAENTSPDAQENLEETISLNPLLGVWVYESDCPVYFYFLDNNVFCYISSYYSSVGLAYDSYVLGTYHTNSTSLTVTFPEGGQMEYLYQISGDMLTLNGEDENFTCQKHHVEATQLSIIGTWQLVGTDGDFNSFGPYNPFGPSVSVNEYLRTVSLYSDYTFKAYMYFMQAYRDEYPSDEFHGTYDVVHDGQSLSFNSRGYYDFTLLGYGLLQLVDPSGNTLIYILQ